MSQQLEASWASRAVLHRTGLGLRVGMDIVSVAAIQASLDTFGERFLRRLFSPEERDWALSAPAQTAERLAARFAAKEAAIKAFDLSDWGVDWRDLAVRRSAQGAPHLALQGRAAQRAQALGVEEWSLSLSHEPEHACAVVVAVSPQWREAAPISLNG